MSTDRARLDVTLRTGQVVPAYMAAWLQALANDARSVSAVVIDEGTDFQTIELQDEEGAASGGLLFWDHRGMVHVLAGLDPHSGRAKKRTPNQMATALTLALEQRDLAETALKFYENRFTYLFAALGLILLAWFVGHGPG